MASSGDDYSSIEPSISLACGGQDGDVPALYDLYLRDRSPISQGQQQGQYPRAIDDEGRHDYERSNAATAAATSSSYNVWRGAQNPSYDDPRYGRTSQDYQHYYPEDSSYPDHSQASAVPSLEGGMQSLRFHDPYGLQSQSQDEHSLEYPREYSREYSRETDQERETDRQSSSDASDLLFTRIPSTRKSRKRGPKSWEFLYRLLSNPEYNPSLIRWEDQATATFRLVQPETIAQMWGTRNEQPNLSYNNFARSLRYHYKSGILIQVSDRQLVYRFGELALESLRSSKK